MFTTIFILFYLYFHHLASFKYKLAIFKAMGLYDNSRNSGYEYFEETMTKYIFKNDVLILKMNKCYFPYVYYLE
jgi:hypothetical protein